MRSSTWPLVLACVALGALACRETEVSARSPGQSATTSVRVDAQPEVTPSAAPRASASAEPEPAAPWPRREPAPVVTDWCIDRVRTLEQGACYVLPAKRSSDLLVYLHGIVPPTPSSVQKTNFQTVVANASERAGVVALIPRGNVGLAPKGHEKWWGWPTTGPSYRRLGPELVERIRTQRKHLEDVVGVTFSRVMVAGSSSGAYFATAIALHGAMDEAHGFGAMSGGAGYRTEELATLRPRPFYVGFGSHDSVAGSARALGKLLTDAGWPVRVAAHPLPHGAREVYLDEAFSHWGVEGGAEQ